MSMYAVEKIDSPIGDENSAAAVPRISSVNGRENRFPDRGRERVNVNMCAFDCFVEKIDSPIGDENNSGSSIHNSVICRENRFPDRGRELDLVEG